MKEILITTAIVFWVITSMLSVGIAQVIVATGDSPGFIGSAQVSGLDILVKLIFFQVPGLSWLSGFIDIITATALLGIVIIIRGD